MAPGFFSGQFSASGNFLWEFLTPGIFFGETFAGATIFSPDN